MALTAMHRLLRRCRVRPAEVGVLPLSPSLLDRSKSMKTELMTLLEARDDADAEIIDLAQRNSFPAVAARKGRSEGVGMVAGIALVAALGAVTLWSMNSARVAEPEGIGSAQPAPQE